MSDAYPVGSGASGVVDVSSGGRKVEMGSFTPAAATGTVTTKLTTVDGVILKEDIVTNVVEVQDGYFIPPEEPGLGIDINVEEMAKHPYEAGPGDQTRRPDGSLTLG